MLRDVIYVFWQYSECLMEWLLIKKLQHSTAYIEIVHSLIFRCTGTNAKPLEYSALLLFLFIILCSVE